ncbi:hypothetical protein HZB04_02290 [Candidatus Wolfebacteria bacterium]|nr:hypothetical protein [Candidatus Wolfebacteria bacterium]
MNKEITGQNNEEKGEIIIPNTIGGNKSFNKEQIEEAKKVREDLEKTRNRIEELEKERNIPIVKEQEETINKYLKPEESGLITDVRKKIHEWNLIDNDNYFNNEHQIKEAIEQVKEIKIAEGVEKTVKETNKTAEEGVGKVKDADGDEKDLKEAEAAGKNLKNDVKKEAAEVQLEFDFMNKNQLKEKEHKQETSTSIKSGGEKELREKVEEKIAETTKEKLIQKLNEKRQVYVEQDKIYKETKKKGETGLAVKELALEKVKLEYEKAKGDYGYKLYFEKIEQLKKMGINEDDPRFKEEMCLFKAALFEDVIIREQDQLAKEKVDALEPRKRTWFRTMIADYAKMPLWKKMALSTGVVTGLLVGGAALGAGGVFAVAAAAPGTYATHRLIRGAIGGKLAMLAGGLVKTIGTRKVEEWRKKELSDLNNRFGMDLKNISQENEFQNFIRVQSSTYENIVKETNRKHKNITRWSIGAGVLTGGLSAYGLAYADAGLFSGGTGKTGILSEKSDSGIDVNVKESAKMPPSVPGEEVKILPDRPPFNPQEVAVRHAGEQRELEHFIAEHEGGLKSPAGLETTEVPKFQIADNVEIKKGDSIWSVAEKYLKGNEEFQKLGGVDNSAAEALKTYNIDRVKDIILANPGKYGLPDGIDTQDMTNLTIEDLKNIKWNDAFNDAIQEKGGLLANLPQEKIDSIVQNNSVLKEFFENNPKAPRTVKNYEAILNGKGNTGIEAASEHHLSEKELEDFRSPESKYERNVELEELTRQKASLEHELARPQARADYLNKITSRIEELQRANSDTVIEKSPVEHQLNIEEPSIQTKSEGVLVDKTETGKIIGVLTPKEIAETNLKLDKIIQGLQDKTISPKGATESYIKKFFGDKTGAEILNKNENKEILNNLKKNFDTIADNKSLPQDRINAEKVIKILFQRLAVSGK